MKLENYIKRLQDLKSKYGNVDVKINKTYECVDLSFNDTFSDAEEPYFDDDNECIVIYYDVVLKTERFKMFKEG